MSPTWVSILLHCHSFQFSSVLCIWESEKQSAALPTEKLALTYPSGEIGHWDWIIHDVAWFDDCVITLAEQIFSAKVDTNSVAELIYGVRPRASIWAFGANFVAIKLVEAQLFNETHSRPWSISQLRRDPCHGLITFESALPAMHDPILG